MGAFAPIIAAGIQAGGSLLGGLIGSQGQQNTNAASIAAAQQAQASQQDFNARQASQAQDLSAQQFNQSMAFNRDQAQHQIDTQWQMMQKQMDYQTEMSNTAYSRAMQGMRDAGLNPILAANLGGASTPTGSAGSGAEASISGSSPGGATSTAVMPTLGNPGSFMGAGVTSAAQAGRTMADIRNLLADAEQKYSTTELNEANRELTGALVKKAAQDTETSASQSYHNRAQARRADAETQLVDVNTTNAAANLPGIQANAVTAAAEARIRRAQADDREAYGQGPGADVMGNVVRGGTTAKRVGTQLLGDIGEIVKGVAGDVKRIPSPTFPRAKPDEDIMGPLPKATNPFYRGR